MAKRIKKTLEEKFNKFVVKNPNGCWDWNGCHADPGYGQFIHERNRYRAHRASWIIFRGEIPQGMFVLHSCDNRICSNPEHLFLGTNLDNIKDMISKNRHPTLNKSGESNHMSILSEIQVRKIKELFKTENSLKKIALLFNVAPSVIGNIKYNLTWRGVS